MVLSRNKFTLKKKGFIFHGKDSHVCTLKKTLYGLKQAPHAWYGQIDRYLENLGFTKSDADPNLYYKIMDDEPLILVVYVDDLFLIGNEKLIGWCKKNLTSEFEIKYLRFMHYLLGL